MIYNDITIEEILERYDLLPDELIDLLNDPVIEDSIETICKKNNITKPEWINTIKQLASFVVLGFLHYYDLGAEINLALNSTNSQLGNEIANEIYLKILEPVKTLLEKNYAPPKPKENEPDLFDLVLEEIKKINEESNNISTSQYYNATKQNTIIKEPTSINIQKEIQTKKTVQFPQIISLKSDIKQTPKTEKIKNINEVISPPKPIPEEPIKNKILDLETKFDINKNEKLDYSKNINNTYIPSPSPNPKFIFKHEFENPNIIKNSGIENKIPKIDISKINHPSPPPLKAKIEIGKKIENESNLSKIKIINYSLSETENNIKNNIPSPPPPPPQSTKQ